MGKQKMKSFKEYIEEAKYDPQYDLSKHGSKRFTSVLGTGKSQTKSWNAKKGDKVTLKPQDRDYPNQTGTIIKVVGIDKRYGRGGAVTYKIKVKGKTIERKNYELIGLDTKVQRSYK